MRYLLVIAVIFATTSAMAQGMNFPGEYGPEHYYNIPHSGAFDRWGGYQPHYGFRRGYRMSNGPCCGMGVGRGRNWRGWRDQWPGYYRRGGGYHPAPHSYFRPPAPYYYNPTPREWYRFGGGATGLRRNRYYKGW